MIRRVSIPLVLLVLAACGDTTAPAPTPAAAAAAPAAAGAIEPWMPVNAAFAGCQGACGAAVTAPDPDVVAQPGANIGQRTFCPVSGAVFRVEATHHHAEVGGQRLWF